jgi:SM-20-related protein
VTTAIDRICAAIADEGCAVEADFLPGPSLAALADEAHRRDEAGDFHAAGVGRGAAHARRTDVRGDRILWLDERAAGPAEAPLWQALDALRLALNAALQLGLFSVEMHYALYPPGASYRRHRDQFRNSADASDVRVMSCAMYLNRGWTPADGGALRIYDGDRVRDVLPRAGTIVCFLSDRFEHEVLPATRPRLSLTGWFRRRALASIASARDRREARRRPARS